ncbi:hypothetical protein APR08_004640 [Nocardia amikacinitolerans]|nr:hypothetical protein [Nocardia amikacinitolerans]
MVWFSAGIPGNGKTPAWSCAVTAQAHMPRREQVCLRMVWFSARKPGNGKHRLHGRRHHTSAHPRREQVYLRMVWFSARVPGNGKTPPARAPSPHKRTSQAGAGVPADGVVLRTSTWQRENTACTCAVTTQAHIPRGEVGAGVPADGVVLRTNTWQREDTTCTCAVTAHEHVPKREQVCLRVVWFSARVPGNGKARPARAPSPHMSRYQSGSRCACGWCGSPHGCLATGRRGLLVCRYRTVAVILLAHRQQTNRGRT